jgi:drug/metabolite transporter (DMT)-like permease
VCSARAALRKSALTPLPRWLGIALLLVVAVTFGLNHIAARVAFDHGANVVTAVAFRSAGTALALLALLLALRVPLALPRTTRWRAFAIGIVVAVQSYCIYAAVARLPVALALLTFNTYPLLFAFMAWAAGMERPSRSAFAAMLVALFGLALALDVTRGGTELAARWEEIGTGVAFATGASLSFALMLFLNARWLHGVDGRVRSFFTMSSCGAVAIAGAAATGFALPADGTGWLGLILLTAFYGSAITALFVLQPRMRSSSDVAVLNFEPVALLFLGWVILDQSLSPLQIAGALVVIGSVVALGMAKR